MCERNCCFKLQGLLNNSSANCPDNTGCSKLIVKLPSHVNRKKPRAEIHERLGSQQSEFAEMSYLRFKLYVWLINWCLLSTWIYITQDLFSIHLKCKLSSLFVHLKHSKITFHKEHTNNNHLHIQQLKRKILPIFGAEWKNHMLVSRSISSYKYTSYIFQRKLVNLPK